MTRRAAPTLRPRAARRMLSATALAGAVALTGCSAHAAAGEPQLKVIGGYVPQPPMPDMAAGYITVVNTGTAPDRLTGVTSDLASQVTMHRTQGGEMREVGSLTVPAGGRLVLGTGGDHLMLMGLTRRPAIGDSVSFRLRFATSAPITVRVPVEPASYRPKG